MTDKKVRNMGFLIGTIIAVAAVIVASVFLYVAGLRFCRIAMVFMNHYD